MSWLVQYRATDGGEMTAEQMTEWLANYDACRRAGINTGALMDRKAQRLRLELTHRELSR